MSDITITSGQERNLVEVFSSLGSGPFQALWSSGILMDVRRCASEFDPTSVDRDALQRVLGIHESVFPLKMGGPENTDEIMAALEFSFDDWINNVNFPLEPGRIPWADEIEVVFPAKRFTEEEGLLILKDHGLIRPTYEHGIRFGQQHGLTTTSKKVPHVTFLHEPWLDPRGARRFIDLHRRAPEWRELGLASAEYNFSHLTALAGVRPRG